MRAFTDSTKDIDERASERMSFRTKPHIKQAIQRAAEVALLFRTGLRLS